MRLNGLRRDMFYCLFRNRNESVSETFMHVTEIPRIHNISTVSCPDTVPLKGLKLVRPIGKAFSWSILLIDLKELTEE